MSLKSMIDYAFPLNPTPVKTDAVLVYAGGDTPHDWTIADMNGQSARYRWPCWVRSNPASVNATTDASEMVAWLQSHNVPVGTYVVLDLETAINTNYVKTFNTVLLGAGYKTTKYGSKSTIFQNPQTSGGTFVADITGVSHMYKVGDTVATQYIFNSNYDLSVYDDTKVQLWDTQPNINEPGFPTPVIQGTTISVIATWNPVIGAESYHFEFVRISDGHVIADLSTNGTVTQATITGLSANTAYQWRVAVHATNNTKASRWSDWQTINV